MAEQNAGAMVSDSDWMRDQDWEKYMLVPSLNGKSRQGCVARVEVPPEEADYFFDNEYTITVNGRVYDNWDATEFYALSEQVYTVTVPPANFEFKPLDPTVTSVQYFASELFDYSTSTYLEVAGEAEQMFEAGFETNPYDENAPDKLNFYWTLDAPNDAISDGSIVYQYVSYVKSGDYNSNIMSVGCATTVGDPYIAKVDTFNGTSSMASDSLAVAGKTVLEQNSDERAKKKDSFKLGNEVVAYKKTWSFISDVDNSIMPCEASLIFDGKIKADDKLFGTYDVTIGARIYSDEFDTEPKSLPSQSFTFTIGEPESDLSALFEEEATEETSEILESFSHRQRFKNSVVFPDEYDEANDADTLFWSHQVASGGYKLYSAKDAVERWYWDLALIMPTKYFTTDRIIYQWITFADQAGSRELTGAVACKIVVGDPTATQVDQWQGVTDLSATSEDVVGKKWYKQQRNGKMVSPDYQALFWQDVFTLVDAPNRTGYSIQHCQAEVKLEDGYTLPDGVTIDMQVGARFYASDDATEFLATPSKPVFDWYNEQLTYDAKYEIEPVYNLETAQAGEKIQIDNDPVDLTSTMSQDRLDAVQAAIDAAAASDVDPNAVEGGAFAVEKSSRQDTTVEATMTVSHGWTIYENEVESDYWWWYIATDMADALLADGEIFYQYATMVDQSAEYTEDPFTVGCAITKGTADTYTIQVFTHTTDPDTTGNLASDADPSVVG